MDKIQSIFIGADKAYVNDEDILNVAQYLHNMGYELKGNGFVNPGGTLKFDENDKNKVTEIDSKYIWSYLVADNGTYMVKNNNFNFGDFFSHLFDSENWGAGMINFDDWTVDDWLSSVVFDRDEKTMTISIPNRDGLRLAKDTTVYNIDGWSGRYGKPLEFMLSLHLATMAPELTYKLATDKDFETTVHVSMLKVKTKIQTNVISDTNIPYTEEDFKSYVDKGQGDDTVFFLPTKENGESYTYNEVYQGLKELNDDNFYMYLPHITWVEKHWFRDVYFDVDAGDIDIYTNNKNGEKTDSIEVVEKEEKEDGKYWDKYNTLDENGYSEELATKTIDGIHVYRIVEMGEGEGKSDSSDLERAILNSSVLADIKDNLDMKIEGYKIVQVKDAERGVTNKAIKDLFADKYYIYDGSEVTADAIEKKKVKKRNISLSRDSLAAFTILENTHTLDADYIYKDLKELLIELKYFKQEELIDDDIKVLKWPIPDYNKESGYELWPDNEIDKTVYEYGTYITSKSKYDSEKKAEEASEEEASLNDTKLASLEFVSGVQTLKVSDETTTEDEASEEEEKKSSKVKNEGYEAGKDVISPANGEIESAEGGIKITIDDSEEYTTKSGENICSGYQIVISGFSVSKSSGSVKAGDKIGKTTEESIKITFLDEDKAVVENVEDYIILPGEEKKEKPEYEEGYSIGGYGDQGNGDSDEDEGDWNDPGDTPADSTPYSGSLSEEFYAYLARLEGMAINSDKNFTYANGGVNWLDGEAYITVGPGLYMNETNCNAFRRHGYSNFNNKSTSSVFPKDITAQVFYDEVDSFKATIESYMQGYPLTQNQMEALIISAYQRGTGSSSTLYKNVLDPIKNGKTGQELLNTWIIYGGNSKYKAGAQNRRYAEWYLFTYGKYVTRYNGIVTPVKFSSPTPFQDALRGINPF